jgi:deoxyribodipyrimidine photo-lyase
MVRAAAFVFRRDLRVHDNVALADLARLGHPIIPVFIFDREQADPRKNAYFSQRAFDFMLASLRDLGRDCPLRFLETHEELARLDLVAVGFNEDYTPYARERDLELKRWCRERSIRTVTSNRDYTLLPMGTVGTKGTGEAYKVFGPFYRACKEHDVPRPIAEGSLRWHATPLLPRAFPSWIPRGRSKGGRTHALGRLQNIDLAPYASKRDCPTASATSRLSPYLKFGCISVREAYHRFSRNEAWTRQLYWREFYAYNAWSKPAILRGQVVPGAENADFKDLGRLPWSDRKDWFDRWKRGQTGFPIVDAGMRALAETGFLHNRLRMIVAVFLVKDLLIDWRWGERYFATMLEDYDPCSNNGGWQWCASTGADSQPYFRVFNPWRQAERFDPRCVYVKRWVPELRDVPVRDILAWHATSRQHAKTGYPQPLVDHKKQALKAKRMFLGS